MKNNNTRQIHLSAGHSPSRPGARYYGRDEAEMAIKLKNALASQLAPFGTVRMISDRLDLRGTIAKINESARTTDLAAEIHFNSGNWSLRGTEVYYHNAREKAIAEIFSKEISDALNIPNRGARPDRWTWVGQLGFLRKLKCDSVLVEVCYLTSDSDMAKYDVDKAVEGATGDDPIFLSLVLVFNVV